MPFQKFVARCLQFPDVSRTALSCSRLPFSLDRWLIARAGAAIPDHRPVGGFGFLEVECNRCRASLPLGEILRPRNTPIWKLEVALKCRSGRKGPLCAAGPHD